MSFVKYIKSAVLPKDYPITHLNEIAFVGRSNAGKSSLINSLCRCKIANVSSTPGKTRLLSFFNFNDSYVLVDMPGYGFAARSRTEVDQWQGMIEDYFEFSEPLAGVILVMDIRRDWDKEEKMIKKFAEHFGFPLILALTKADKLSFSQKSARLNVIQKEAQLENIFVCSSLKNDGIDDLQKYILKKLIKVKRRKG